MSHSNYESVSIAERREHLRSSGSLNGYIKIDESIIKCRIRGLSITGARIELSEEADHPKVFELGIEGIAEPRECVLVWKLGNAIGVRFA